MSAVASWQGWVTVLLTAVSATAVEPTSVPAGAAPDRVAAARSAACEDCLRTASQAAPMGIVADGQQGPLVGPVPGGCGLGCEHSLSFAGWLLDGSCCPSQPCELPWFPIGRITCQSPPHVFWYGEVTAVGLKRDAEPSGGAIATLDTPDNVVLYAREAWPDFRAGAMVRLGRMFTPTWGIEYSYLGTDTWQADAAVRDQTPNTPGGLGNLFSPFGDFGDSPVEDFDYNELVSIRGNSHVESFELSLRNRLCMPPEPLQVSVFYGIRYISLGERFDYYSQSQVPLAIGATQLVDVRTRNDLLGGQIGALLEWHIEPQWWFDTRLAAGLYHNRAAQATLHRETGDNPGENFLEHRGERGTVGAEVSLALLYYFRPNLSTRFGYQFLWLDRVALAAENFETDPVILREGPAQLNVEGTIMFHGPFLGVALAW